MLSPPRSSRRSPKADTRSAAPPLNFMPSQMVYRAGACYASAMPGFILPLAEAAAHLPARGALIRLELRSKTIGVGTSDPDRQAASGVRDRALRKFFVE